MSAEICVQLSTARLMATVKFSTKSQIGSVFFFFFWSFWAFVAMHGLSLIAVSGSYSLCAQASVYSGFSFQSTGSRVLWLQ